MGFPQEHSRQLPLRQRGPFGQPWQAVIGTGGGDDLVDDRAA
jgi:hypothetical protein